MSAQPTIIAIASPPGQSLRGIVRVSGEAAFDLVHPHLQPRTGAAIHAMPGASAFASTLTVTGLPSFSVLTIVFRRPRSYTGEDSIELQMPGNSALLEHVLTALLNSGRARGLDVRRAEPGEFTARAFLSGRIDLTQAEGVAATIAAQSDAELAAARVLTSGRLATLAREMADELGAALALVEAGIDFTDQDDVVAISPHDLLARLRGIDQRLQNQLDRSVPAETLRAIPWVVLAGEPNAGKSALFNALLGRERAVVSSIAGTTRDVLAEPLTIDTPHGRAEVMLVDLAGLDDEDPSTMNALMQAAARGAMERAELILQCIPIDAPTEREQGAARASSPRVRVRTKADLADSAPSPDGIRVSAFTGEGLDELRHVIAERLADRAVSLSAGAVALQPRHEHAMRSAAECIQAAIGAVEPHAGERSLDSPEIVAADMRAALDALASLAGELTPDDILGRIFATFCIGK